ncbi:hypothetical protein GSH19_05860 [Lactobacillus sp. S2-2]|uniref:hypothetical protein n=1 Tax=Lactobacillus sp. S2-2 TaxID=2692917 RepID=UPI001F2C60B5|nr:hypothetical protein [Lactobacillus sp. S2-2]MCF6515672.1 hypothetical protein [Lactobacillus sp. S2-2]
MLKPIGNRIVVELKNKTEQSIGGIIIPNDSDESSQNAVVLSVSDEINEIKKDEEVLINKNSGMKFNDGGKSVLIVDLRDVLAIIK